MPNQLVEYSPLVEGKAGSWYFASAVRLLEDGKRVVLLPLPEAAADDGLLVRAAQQRRAVRALCSA